jgi:predicted alpha/beta superfamily hydrolase
MKLKIVMIVALLMGHFNVELLADSTDVNKENSKFPRVGIRDTELRSLKSEIVGDNYEIDVSLPRGYHSETDKYPVIYVLDAEYNFGCVAYITRRLIKNRDIPKVIVVGIAYNTTYETFYDKRMRDCTPPSKFYGHQTGGIEKFIAFFKKELIPFINSNYRTQPRDLTIVGHSIGGFFGCYVLLKHPQLFKRYIVASPSLWYADRIAFSYEKTYAGTHENLEAVIFLATGEAESSLMTESSRDFINILNKRQYKNLKFKGMMPKGEHHRSVFPFAYTRGLQFIFKAKD